MPKRQGRHPEKALTAVQVRQIKLPGRYTDGNGLYLVVDPSGAKRWVLRTVVNGTRRDIGLGGVTLVSLAEAREKALQYRKVAREGGDPVADRRKLNSAQKATAPTFMQAAALVHAEYRHGWKNEKHGAQWITTLRTYAYPYFGNRPIDFIETPDILKALAPIWLTKPETARRVRQRIGTVFDWAKAAGHRMGDNPIDGVAKGLPKQTDQDKHHEALPYAVVPQFITKLRNADVGSHVRLAFELLILTASRTSEVVGMKWSEVDEAEGLWTIPAERMKAKRQHRVALSARALEILDEARKIKLGSVHVFPGRNATKPLSNMVFLMTLRRMDVKVTAHGFRSSFRDWAAEQTNYPREVCEMALAHTIENKVEAAYRRGDLFEKRRELMNAWAAYVEAA
ncbi:MAG: integrase arm-type DNA-binding domain-containing protein [Beijerinckiaceae bacterium]|nr:integrase arm-type DNA-binding domain-containing protein [Beijerinckiaceae bacterium]